MGKLDTIFNPAEEAKANKRFAQNMEVNSKVTNARVQENNTLQVQNNLLDANLEELQLIVNVRNKAGAGIKIDFEKPGATLNDLKELIAQQVFNESDYKDFKAMWGRQANEENKYALIEAENEGIAEIYFKNHFGENKFEEYKKYLGSNFPKFCKVIMDKAKEKFDNDENMKIALSDPASDKSMQIFFKETLDSLSQEKAA